MAIDPYAACPGGKDKKIKFCCADLVGDLEKLDRLIEGDQLSAALEMANRLDAAHPGRACLLASKTKLELAAAKYGDAAATNRSFLEAFPDNPLALGQAAMCEVLSGKLQEAASTFDHARESLPADAGATAELGRIGFSLAQAAAETGHVGMAQSLAEWINERGLGTEEERRMLAAVIGGSGIPAGLRPQPALEETTPESPWRFEFQTALKHAAEWRLGKALRTFRSLKGLAGESRELFTNIAILCEKLARPFEAAEAWLKVADMPGLPADDAVEATARAIALEQEANPEQSPNVPLARCQTTIPDAEASGDKLDLLEDGLRHDPRFEAVDFDRSDWVSRGAVPPRSVWRVYDAAATETAPARLLASLLIFGRQTDRSAEAALQGFDPDLAEARVIVEPLVHGSFGDSVATNLATPTMYLVSAQYRPKPPSPLHASAPGQPSAFDIAVGQQHDAVRERFVSRWPDTPLPELLGHTPVAAMQVPSLRRRVEAVLLAGLIAGRPELAPGWSELRERLGLPPETPLEAARPVEELHPFRWHRVVLAPLETDQLRLLLGMSMAAGFELSAERAASEVLARAEKADAAIEPVDQWEALGFLESRAAGSVEKLDLLARLRKLAPTIGSSEAMLDVLELRVRLQRGDQAEIPRLLDRLRRGPQDPRILRALAEVLAEAGVDLSALAAARGGMPVGGGAGPAGLSGAGLGGSTAAASGSGLWTPDGGAASASGEGGGEKKVIWTPGS